MFLSSTELVFVLTFFLSLFALCGLATWLSVSSHMKATKFRQWRDTPPSHKIETLHVHYTLTGTVIHSHANGRRVHSHRKLEIDNKTIIHETQI